MQHLLHPQDIRHRLIVPIAELNQASKQAVAYARSIAPHVTAVHVAVESAPAPAGPSATASAISIRQPARQDFSSEKRDNSRKMDFHPPL